MDIIDKIRSKFSYRVTRPLVYDEAMRSAYSTTSVAGGTLRGKTAVVTGATGGIGRATAQRLLNGGCDVGIPFKQVWAGAVWRGARVGLTR